MTRPQCLRCVKYGVQCPGYRSQLELQSLKPCQRQKRDNTAFALPRIPPSLSQHWMTYSIPLFLDTFSTSDFIQSLYYLFGRSQALACAAHLFSHTYLLNSRHPGYICTGFDGETKRMLHSYLVEALNAVQTALKSPNGTSRDDILATIFILAFHEVSAATFYKKKKEFLLSFLMVLILQQCRCSPAP